MQISKPLNIVPSLPLICGCASAADGRQCAGLQGGGADEMSAPDLPCLQALGIDAGDVDGQRHRQDDGASG